MSGGKNKWIKRILGNTALLGFTLFVCLVGAEFAVRVLAPQPTGLSHQDRFGLALHYPGITRHLPQYGHEVSFNSVGMRDREHPLAKGSAYRILILGDSFMEALQVRFEDTLAQLLENRLGDELGREFEVINAGVSGWGTDDALRYLKDYGSEYRPDLVLVAMTLHNDIDDNLREAWHTLEGGRVVERDREPIPLLEFKTLQLKAFVATRFQTWQLWRRFRHRAEIQRVTSDLDSHIVELFREPVPERIERGVQLTDGLLAQVKAEAATWGGEVAVVLLPLLVQQSGASFDEFLEQGSLPDDVDRERPQRAVIELSERLNLPVVDLLPRFSEWTESRPNEPLYLDWDGHWNEAGHALAYEVVASELAKLELGSSR